VLIHIIATKFEMVCCVVLTYSSERYIHAYSAFNIPDNLD